MEIESYRFGEIVIGGKVYRTDVIVFPDKVVDNWWRREGHRLDITDLGGALTVDPKVMIVGTGYYGRMEIPATLAGELACMGVELIAQETTEACDTYNNCVSTGSLNVGLFHITC